MQQAIRVRRNIGIGDAIQFTSLPENYFKHTGEKMILIGGNSAFDFNPYVEKRTTSDAVEDLWTRHCLFPKHPDWWPRSTVLLSNAESIASYFDVPVLLNRPRLYQFEDFPFFERKNIDRKSVV